jgi:hypothetical protein
MHKSVNYEQNKIIRLGLLTVVAGGNDYVV